MANILNTKVSELFEGVELTEEQRKAITPATIKDLLLAAEDLLKRAGAHFSNTFSKRIIPTDADYDALSCFAHAISIINMLLGNKDGATKAAKIAHNLSPNLHELDESMLS